MLGTVLGGRQLLTFTRLHGHALRAVRAAMPSSREPARRERADRVGSVEVSVGQGPGVKSAVPKVTCAPRELAEASTTRHKRIAIPRKMFPKMALCCCGRHRCCCGGEAVRACAERAAAESAGCCMLHRLVVVPVAVGRRSRPGADRRWGHGGVGGSARIAGKRGCA